MAKKYFYDQIFVKYEIHVTPLEEKCQIIFHRLCVEYFLS